jgi:pimeloyl-ACP methyl ester carboxylesterase
MDIILIPGLWLTSSSWDALVTALEAAGHRTHPLTLPGMESPGADRSRVSRQDHVDAAIAAIDATDDGEKALLVGHSMGGGIAWAAADARVDRVAGVVFLASEPQGSGEGGPSPFPAEAGEIPLPDWDFFDAEMVEDLDDDLRRTIRAGSVPSPERAVTDGLSLSDERRYDLPVTMITAEYDEAQLRAWIDEDVDGVEEIVKLRNVRYVDLHSGHWPQYSRVDDAARLVLEAAARG